MKGNKIPYQTIFNVLVVYYWIVIFTLGFIDAFEKYSVVYFLYVLPIFIFIILCLPKICKITNRTIIPLWIFLFFVILISIVRLDIGSIITFTLLVLTIIALVNYNLKVNLKLFNALYLLSIVLAIILFHLNLTDYGYIPGQTRYLRETWRISITPFLLDSGIYSLLIFIINYYFNKNKRLRIFFLILSFYVLVFTGIRSALIIFLIFALFVLVSKNTPLKDRFFYRLYSWGMVFGIIFVLFFNSFLIVVAQKIDMPLFNRIILKEENAVITQKQLKKTIFRTWIWEQHYHIFKRNPLMGIGTFDLAEEVVYPPDAPGGLTGSESPLTWFFARIGICTIFFILFFRNLWIGGLKLNDKYKYLLPLVILVSLLTYGSYFNPYNFFFLILFASYNGIYIQKNRETKSVLCRTD